MKMWVLLFLGFFSCAKDMTNPNFHLALNEKTDYKEAVIFAVERGEESLYQVKRYLIGQNKQKEAGAYLAGLLKSECGNWSAQKLVNGINLILSTRSPEISELFASLSRHSKSSCQQIAWQLPASYASEKMAKAVELRLEEAIINSELQHMFWPPLANAIAQNGLTGSYSVLRQGLFVSQHVDFAKAMIALDPKKASWDFMEYLSMATLEELRQLSLENVDLFTCMEIFNHFKNYPVAVSHPKFAHLFFFSISRNTALAEMAQSILAQYLPRFNENLAFTLSRLPVWVQISFIEGARRNMTAKFDLFLSELKKNSGQREVLEEIDAIAR